jgi:hypothetical protein
VERALSVDSSLQSLGSSWKSSLESITNHLVCIPAIGSYGMAENSFLAGKGGLHGLPVRFPAPGASLYVGEQESSRSSRGLMQSRHMTSPPSYKGNANKVGLL